MTEQAPKAPSQNQEDDNQVERIVLPLNPADTSSGLIGYSPSRVAELGPSVIGDPRSEAAHNLAVQAIVEGKSREQILEGPKAAEAMPHQEIGKSLQRRPDYTIPERPGQAGGRSE